MTKKDARIFLEQKQYEKIAEHREQYKTDCQAYRDQQFQELGFTAVAQEIEGYFNKALTTYEKWRNNHAQADGLKINVAYYDGLNATLYPYTKSKGACYNQLTRNEVNLDTVALDKLTQQHDKNVEATYANYNAVLSTLTTLKPKEVGSYPTELWFDISEYENRPPQLLAAKI